MRYIRQRIMAEIKLFKRDVYSMKPEINPLNFKNITLFIVVTVWMICTPVCAQNVNAQEVVPKWLEESISHAKYLNIKDPAVALVYLQRKKVERDNAFSSFQLALLNTEIAINLYEVGFYDQSLALINDILEQTPQSSLRNREKAQLLYTKGSIVSFKGDAKLGYQLTEQAVALAIELDDQLLLADAYSSMGAYYQDIYSDIESLKYFQKAHQIFNKLNAEVKLSHLQLSMALAYYYIYDYEKARLLAEKSLAYFTEHAMYFDSIVSHQILASIFTSQDQYKHAISLLEDAVLMSDYVLDKQLNYQTYRDLSSIYLQIQNIEKAKFYWYLMDEVKESIQSPVTLISHLMLKVDIDLRERNLSSAKELLSEVDRLIQKFDKLGNNFLYSYFYQLKVSLAEIELNFEQALFWQKQIRTLEQLLQNLETEESVAKYLIQSDTEQALLKNKLLEEQKKAREARLEVLKHKNSETMVYITGSVIFILLLFLFISRQSRATKVLSTLANTDVLTQLANRRFTFEQGQLFFSQKKHVDADFALISFDIDHFKQVNDSYGHPIGDSALAHISQVVKQCIRADDVLGRIGGEEFLLFLPGASLEKAAEKAELLRKEISSKPLIVDGKSIFLSASFGVSARSSNTATFCDLYKLSDNALYQAKQNGRNCIVCLPT